jgi:hypothetical protein
MEKVVDQFTMPAPHDGECEECGWEFRQGEYVVLVREDEYVYYIHENCPVGGRSDR